MKPCSGSASPLLASDVDLALLASLLGPRLREGHVRERVGAAIALNISAGVLEVYIWTSLVLSFVVKVMQETHLGLELLADSRLRLLLLFLLLVATLVRIDHLLSRNVSITDVAS